MGTAWACASGAPSAAPVPDRTSGPFFASTTQELRLGRQAESILELVNDTRRLALTALLVGLVVHPSPLWAQQPTTNGWNLDKLQLVSLGAFGGRILPSQVEPTNMYGVVANYGEFASNWSILFSVSYWDSRYRDAVVQTFIDSLNRR